MLAGQILNGLVTGAMYALVAIGFSLVIGTLDKLNFAHSEVFMLGGFIALVTVSYMPWELAILVIFLVGGLLGLATEFIAFRRFRSAEGKITAALASMAMGLIITDLAHKWWGTEPVPLKIESEWLQKGYTLFGATVLNLQILILAVAFVLMAMLHVLLQKSRMGRQIRALAESPVSASLLGINVRRVTQTVFFVSSALAAVGGFLVALRSGAASSDIGMTFGLKSLAIMAIGGMGDLRGALIGGLLIGVLEALMFQAGLGRLVELTAWVALILVLMFRPNGLFGGGVHGQEQRA
ncbi:branched-chain amino acid ABC transporter permease [Variovorax sp. ZT4R33]|uniref:branched-chain amino acid ABC transporter permease n=1 Tax=Variovorax sp. ZT4R33 TaxID=3443743 RepID=UPI003F47F4E8